MIDLKKMIESNLSSDNLVKDLSDVWNKNEALEFHILGLEDGTLYVEINGNKYGYKSGRNLSIESIFYKLKKMYQFSPGRSLTWLKNNTILVYGGKNQQK